MSRNPYTEIAAALIPAMGMLADIREAADNAAPDGFQVTQYAIARQDYRDIGNAVFSALTHLTALMEEWENDNV